MNRLGWTALLSLGLSMQLSAQSGVAGRWSVRLTGEFGRDQGDLRLSDEGGRILLQSADTQWVTVDHLSVNGNEVSFRLAGERQFVGRLDGDWLRGRLHDPEQPPLTVDAQRIQPGTVHWPVRPRLRTSELVVGTRAATSRFSDRWRELLLPRDSLLAAHTRLAAQVGMPRATLADIVARAPATIVGERVEGRQLAIRALERIAASPAADRRFRQLFRPDSIWLLDLHQVAWRVAAERIGPGPLRPDQMRGDLIAAGILSSSEADTAHLSAMIWQLVRNRDRVSALGARMSLPGTEQQLLGLRAVMDAYGEARRWWLEAVDWLMQHEWIDTGTGYTSPVALVRQFWQDSTLHPPPLSPTDYGGMQAVPVMGVGVLFDSLVTPVNAVADEWLASRHARRDLFEAWRQIRQTGAGLPVVLDSDTLMLRDPAEVVRSRLGGFIAADDRILIDPTILPIFAVGTLVHEWQHLIFHAARLTAVPAPGWRRAGWGIRLFDGDPWLAEGAAEWATERIFAPVPLFTFVEAEKRLALGARRPDDTHVLGYLLVHAAAARTGSDRRTRELLVADLHAPEQLARDLGLDGPVSRTLSRPNTLMLIPELTFVYDEGVAGDVGRRLLVPALTPEPD